MVTNLETRQNDVVESSNNSGGGLLTEMYHDFKKLVKRKVEKNEKKAKEKKQEEQRKKEENEKNQRFKEDFVKKQAEKADRIYKDQQEQKKQSEEKQQKEFFEDSRDLMDCTQEVVNSIKSTEEKVYILKNMIDGLHISPYHFSDLYKKTNIQLENDKGQKGFFTEYYELTYDWKTDIKTKKSFLHEPKPIKTYSRAFAKCLIKDPSGQDDDVWVTDMTIGDFRMVMKMINADIDNKIKNVEEHKEKQHNKKKSAMERIAGQKIAQNNEEYHQQEEQQADAYLESQLGDLA